MKQQFSPVGGNAKNSRDGAGPSEAKGVMQKKGTIAALANKAGMSPAAFAKANIHATGVEGKLARLYYTREGVHGGGKSTMKKAGDKRTSAHKLYQVG